MSEEHDAVGKDELIVVVEMGDDFEPGTRTAAALAELADALEAEHGDDVSGFASPTIEPVRSFGFVAAPSTGGQFYEGWPSKWKAGWGQPGATSFDGKVNDPLTG